MTTRGRPRSSAPSLKRTDLAQELGKELGTFSAGAKVVQSFFDVVKDALAAGENVSILGLGRFKIIVKTSRRGRNPLTGEERTIGGRSSVSFKPSVKMRDEIVNDSMIKANHD